MKALITGASSGMGSDMARILAKTYDELILVGRNIERLDNLKKEIEESNKTKIKTISIDLTDYKNCIKLYEENFCMDACYQPVALYGGTGKIRVG